MKMVVVSCIGQHDRDSNYPSLPVLILFEFFFREMRLAFVCNCLSLQASNKSKKCWNPRMSINKQQVRTALTHVMHPEMGKDLVTLNMVEDLIVQDKFITFTI